MLYAIERELEYYLVLQIEKLRIYFFRREYRSTETRGPLGEKEKEKPAEYIEKLINGRLNISNQGKIIFELVKQGLGSFHYQRKLVQYTVDVSTRALQNASSRK
jgi:hypothetical protein